MTECICLSEELRVQLTKILPYMKGNAVLLLKRHRLKVTDDRIQDLLLAAMQGALRWRGECTLQSFCYRSLRWRVIDLVREARRQESRLTEVLTSDHLARDCEEPDWSLLDVLPERYRLCLMLAHGIGCAVHSYAEIADAFGRTISTVERWHRKGCEMLVRLADA